MTISPKDPITTARRIVSDANLAATLHPEWRMDAWMILMQAKGQRVDPASPAFKGRFAHMTAEQEAAREAFEGQHRIREKIRAHAQKRGFTILDSHRKA